MGVSFKSFNDAVMMFSSRGVCYFIFIIHYRPSEVVYDDLIPVNFHHGQ